MLFAPSPSHTRQGLTTDASTSIDPPAASSEYILEVNPIKAREGKVKKGGGGGEEGGRWTLEVNCWTCPSSSSKRPPRRLDLLFLRSLAVSQKTATPPLPCQLHQPASPQRSRRKSNPPSPPPPSRRTSLSSPTRTTPTSGRNTGKNDTRRNRTRLTSTGA